MTCTIAGNEVLCKKYIFIVNHLLRRVIRYEKVIFHSTTFYNGCYCYCCVKSFECKKNFFMKVFNSPQN